MGKAWWLGTAVAWLLFGCGGQVSAEQLSFGCGQQPPGDPPSRIEVEGLQRELIAVIPSQYLPTVAHRLVFAFHGRTNSNLQARSYFRLEQAAKVPTIFVYPAGLRGKGGKYSWYSPGDSRDGLRDFAFFDAILATLGARYCIDLDQVFVVGHSLGASFANSLGCARGAVIRGVGTVAGGRWGSHCSGPAAAIIIHNPKDKPVPIERGEAARDGALAQNGFDPVHRSCTFAGLECQCFGESATPDPVAWCLSTQDHTGSGRLYPHLWPTEAGRGITSFFDSLPASPRTGP